MSRIFFILFAFCFENINTDGRPKSSALTNVVISDLTPLSRALLDSSPKGRPFLPPPGRRWQA